MTQSVCASFKSEILQGIHVIGTDTLKMALYLESATLSSATTVYTTTNETSGTGYTAGGAVITSAAVSLSGSVAIVDFDNVEWANSTINARYALIYNSSKANRAIAVLDFGSLKSTAASTFRVVIPAPTASSAIIRIA